MESLFVSYKLNASYSYCQCDGLEPSANRDEMTYCNKLLKEQRKKLLL